MEDAFAMMDSFLEDNFEIPVLNEEIVEVENHESLLDTTYDHKFNLLDPMNLQLFTNYKLFEADELFTEPKNVTTTLEGLLTNTSFHEEQLINTIAPDEDIVMCCCNFGQIKYNGYTVPVPVRKTNRGRKKKVKAPSTRKQQGDGSSFNSQITIHIRSQNSNLEYDNSIATKISIVPYLTPIYQFKVFRTGKLQLPGARPDTIADIVASVGPLVDMMNRELHPTEYDLLNIVRLLFISPVMSNYKFVLNLPNKHIIKLRALHKIFMDEMSGQRHNDNHPKIYKTFLSKKTHKLTVEFASPTYENPARASQCCIFTKGKCNILGAVGLEQTRNIAKYFCSVLRQNYEDIVVEIGSPYTLRELQQLNDVKVKNPTLYYDEF